MALLRPSQHHLEKKTAHASEQDRPDIVKRRQTWFDSQLNLDTEKLVFIDETWATTNMARKNGRAPRGERLRAIGALEAIRLTLAGKQLPTLA